MYTDSNEAVQNNFVFICDLKTAVPEPLERGSGQPALRACCTLWTRPVAAGQRSSDDAVDEGGELRTRQSAHFGAGHLAVLEDDQRGDAAHPILRCSRHI